MQNGLAHIIIWMSVFLLISCGQQENYQMRLTTELVPAGIAENIEVKYTDSARIKAVLMDENYDAIGANHFLKIGSSFYLPVSLYVTEYAEYSSKMVNLTEAQAKEKARALKDQAAALEQQNAALEQHIDDLNTLEGIENIAKEELGLVDPDTIIFDPQGQE